VAAAVRAGEVSAQHVEVISAALDRVWLVAKPEVVPVAEELLVPAARHEHPRQLAKTAQLLLARLDPDGLEPREEETDRRRGFSLAKLADGSSIPRGRFTPELTAAWEAIFDSLAAPEPVRGPARPTLRATAAAASPAATGPPPGPKSITSSNGKTAGPPTWTTSAYCAARLRRRRCLTATPATPISRGEPTQRADAHDCGYRAVLTVPAAGDGHCPVWTR
jgi:hypothetical protein